MAPATRSATKTASNPASPAIVNSTPTRVRKVPHCTKCSSPMRGHDKAACRTPVTPRTPNSLSFKADPADDLYERLRNLAISSMDDEKPDIGRLGQRVVTPKKEPSLVSLTSSEQGTLDSIGFPGKMTDVVTAEDKLAFESSLQHWLEKVPTTPSPSPGNQRTLLQTITNTPSPRKVHFPTRIDGSPKSILRKRNTAEGQGVLRKVMGNVACPVAAVFEVDMQGVEESDLEAEVQRLELYAKVTARKYGDGTMGPGWLVIGKDARKVDSLFEEVVSKNVKDSRVATALGGGAIAGAVAAWTYLAFS